MTDPFPAEEATLFPKTAGERLREAREAQGLSLAEIAARTRVPVRQLEAIEQCNYAALPSVTYSIGFARAYARAVGVDEVAVAREVRTSTPPAPAVRRTDYEAYAIDDAAARVPTRGLAIGALIAAVLVVVAAGLWYGTSLFRGEDATPVAGTPSENAAAGAVPVAPATWAVAASGPVVLTATDEVWLKTYDAAGKTLFQGTLKPGDRYEVPADAANPMINVGRPDKLTVTLGGQPVAPLGDGHVAIKDVPIGSAALAARGAPAPTANPTAPSPTATSPTGASGSSAATPRPAPSPRAAAARERRTTPSTTTLAPLNIAAPVPVAPEPAPAASPAP